MRRLQFLLVFLCFVSFLAVGVTTQTQEEMNKRKAEYFYLEALTQREQNNMGSYYELMRRATELDTANTTYAYYFGIANLQLPDVAHLNLGLDLMGEFCNEHPDQVYENFTYAMLCKQTFRYDEAVAVLKTLIANDPGSYAPQLYNSLAECYGLMEQYDNAIEAYNELEKLEGKSYDISLQKVKYMTLNKDSISTIQEGRELLETNPKSAFNNLFMGELYHSVNEMDSALAYFDRAMELDPENGRVNLSKAFVYKTLGDSLNYEKEIRLAIFNKGVDFETKREILKAYISESIYSKNESVADKTKSERVEKLFAAVFEQFPREAEFIKLYSGYLAFVEDYKGAAEQAQLVVDMDPTDVSAWILLMRYKMSEDKNEEAIEIGKQAISYNSDDLEIQYLMGIAYGAMEDYENALKQFELVLEKNEEAQVLNAADIYSSIGDMNNALDRIEEARKNYEYALVMSPNNLLTMNNYAYMMAEHNMDIDKAEELSKKTVDGDPENVSYLDTYAWICFVKQDYKKALEYIEKVMEVVTEEEETGELLEHYGDILFMNARPQEALEQWKKALELGGGSDVLERKVKFKTYFYE